ncbi:tetratricopeptide repeat protein [Leptospira selangorensis]|uniref:Tetratricopeptide repeat protein n=1 Tax=Leptospira selangorensis TaxID=2484982 RepID=A0A5F2C957_9LEPT|nr:tetratricopeptide repeat protein [Leptospira selangorensis]TGM13892.1 tetratricopeptide repeat protein [Leptospira selangorensis]TGM27175.1 tetratricopeptide repeat protein [Leptospira selangorensis]
MKYIILFLSIFLFSNQLSADFPLPIPEPSEGNFSSKGTSPDEPLPPIDASSVVAEQRSGQTGPELVSETTSTAGEEPKIAETKQTVSEPVKEKKTKLPNLADKKDKKNGKKKEAVTDPSRAAYERGLLRLRNGQKDAAKEEFGKAASTEGTASSQAKLELSKLENTKAPESNAEAPAEDDSRWKTSLETARSLRAQGKNSEAESILLRTATEGEGEYRSRALLQLGDMLFRMGRYSDARSYLMDFWNRFGKIFPNAEDTSSREFKRQREEKELGAYLLFKSSYKAGEGEWAKRFLKKYLDKSVSESQGVYSPLRTEMESFAKSDL